jgi:polyphosphate kinase 2
MDRSTYHAELKELQRRLVQLQSWVVTTGERVVVLFEGRDTAGKGSLIQAITERVSPRVFRVVALPAPTERERSQLYMQRYMRHMPAAGEIVLFDRSWYNRAGVEPVMGYCTMEERDRFLQVAPGFERYLIDSGIRLIKYWLEVSSSEQKKRLNSRIAKPLKHWKLSPIDLESRRRWYAYSRARDLMFESTDTEDCPWHIVPSDNKFSARLNCINHLLELIPVESVSQAAVILPPRDKADAYDDTVSSERRRFITERY